MLLKLVSNSRADGEASNNREDGDNSSREDGEASNNREDGDNSSRLDGEVSSKVDGEVSSRLDGVNRAVTEITLLRLLSFRWVTLTT